MRLIVVSDIHGHPLNMDWLSILGATDYLNLGDLCNKPSLIGLELHNHLFKQGGVQEAVFRLRDFSESALVGLGFSAGGTVLWRAASEGLQLKTLVCISSTRLRFERNRLAIPTHTFWGELDPHKPDEEWCRTVPNHSTVYEGLGHNFYDEFGSPTASTYQSDIITALENRQRHS